MSVQLYNNDCLEYIKNIQDASIDMILCDPPYGNLVDKTRASWDSDIDYDILCSEFKRIITDHGVIAVFGNEPFSSVIRLKMLDIYKYDFKWVKSKTTGFANANYRPMNKYEDIMVFSKANASTGGKSNPMKYNPQGLIPINKVKKNRADRHGLVMSDTNNTGNNNALLSDGTTYVQQYTNYPCNVLSFDNPIKYLHPTQKPVDLLAYLIRTFTDSGNTVLDCFMGSGSTGVACLHTDRNFIGIELDEKYFKIAQDRIYQEEKQLKSKLF